MNSVVLVGRLTKDIELRFAAGSGKAVAKFTLAVNRDYKNQEGKYDADFINCLAFDKRAETLSQYLSKGSQVAIKGKIQTGSYDAQDGTKRYTTEILIESFDFIGTNNANSNNTNNNNNTNAATGNNDAFGSAYDDITPVDDGDMPF